MPQKKVKQEEERKELYNNVIINEISAIHKAKKEEKYGALDGCWR